MKSEEIKNKTNEAVNHLVAALQAGQSEVLTQYLNAMARFHNYSFGNVMLIARQKPQASNVAGIRTWNSLGRFVKKGERGILILAPMIGRKKADEVADSTADAKGASAQPYGFRAVYVFDVSQTEGEELPTLTEVQGDVSGYRERLFEFVKSHGIELNYSEDIAPAKGLSHRGKITLLPGQSAAEEFATLTHELAHEALHRGDRRTLTTKQLRETEAEAVAFVVCQAIGLDTGSSSANYIQLWHGDAKLLQESLQAVQETAAVILGGIAPEASGLYVDKLPIVVGEGRTENKPKHTAPFPFPRGERPGWEGGPHASRTRRLPPSRGVSKRLVETPLVIPQRRPTS